MDVFKSNQVSLSNENLLEDILEECEIYVPYRKNEDVFNIRFYDNAEVIKIVFLLNSVV